MQVGGELEVVHRREQPVEVGLLVLERGLGELDVPLLDRRPQDHLAAHADGRRLGPRGEGRDGDAEVARRLHQAGQSPALVDLAGVKVRTSCRVIAAATPSTTCTLHLRHVPWPPQVESIATPFQDAASKTLTPGGTRTERWPVS